MKSRRRPGEAVSTPMWWKPTRSEKENVVERLEAVLLQLEKTSLDLRAAVEDLKDDPQEPCQTGLDDETRDESRQDRPSRPEQGGVDV